MTRTPFTTAILGITLTIASLAPSASAKPKYGPDAVPLSQRSNLDYFQKNPAPDFWSLIPYYLPQPTVRACSAMNLMLVLNAARSALPLTSDDKLLTVQDFLKNYTEKAYEKTVMTSLTTFDRSNLTNKNLARILKMASDKLKVSTPKTEVRFVDVDLKNLATSRAEFLKALKDNEKSADDYIVISFVQGTLTGDPEGLAHVATIGAYDEKKDLVLIIDPDRDWYEPYWSPFEKVWDSVRDPRSDGRNPGWVYFRVK